MNKKTAIVRTVSAALLSALICLASCQSPFEPEETVLPGETVTELLELEFGDQDAFTKVGIASVTGKFSWTDGDQVAVWYQNGASGAWSSASISANSLTVSGTGSRAKLAVYPYGAQTDFNLVQTNDASRPVTKIRYAGEIDLTGKDKNYAPVPMIALNDPTRNGLKFYHVGGLIRFRLHGIPAGTRYIRISSDAAPLCGDFPVAIPTGNEINAAELVYSKSRWCTLYDETSWNSLFGSSHGQSVLVKITDGALAAETDDITINLPVPMGVYNQLTVQAIGADGTTDLTGSAPYERKDKAVVWDCERATATHLQNLALRPDHPMVNPNYVPGKFSVSLGKQVWFAKGNLVVTYKSSGDHLWEFEKNQYDYSFGNGGRSADVGYQQDGVRISHFGWATAGVRNNGGDGYDGTHVNFMPYSISCLNQFEDNTYGYGPSISTSPRVWADDGGANIPFGQDADNSWNAGDHSDPTSPWNTVRPYCDWGVHFDKDGNGANSQTGGTWYTLSNYEWNYLFNVRDEYGLRVGKGMIFVQEAGKFVNGLFILPDNWEKPSSCKFRSGGTADYSTNIYTTGDDLESFDGSWAEMEASGAVFLPAAGSRSPGDSYSVAWSFGSSSNFGYYWASSASGADSNGNTAYGMSFNPSNLYARDAGVMRYLGYSVRLVHD